MNKKAILKKVKYSLRFLPDRVYIQLYYFMQFKHFCNLRHPRTYNEKLQWLKLNDRKDMYTTMVDKYEVKKYVAEKIGAEYVIPTLGIYDNFDDIDFENLPNQFVIKCTHDSEGIVICKDKSKFDKEKARKKINEALKYNFYYIGREWPYKNIKPRIMVEKYMENAEDKELKDYKFFCFNGKPKVMYVASDRGIGKTKIDFFDMNFKRLDIKQHYPNSTEKINKPEKFETMIELAKKISSEFIHIRVDFYEVNGKVYFGEITFYNFSGFSEICPDKWNKIFGDWLEIPIKKVESNKRC